LKTGYAALMLFDQFDQEYRRSSPTFWTGLYVSNTTPVAISGCLANLEIADFLEMFNSTQNNFQSSKISIVSSGGSSFKMVGTPSSGDSFIIASFKE
jgi:hypothetical protein